MRWMSSDQLQYHCHLFSTSEAQIFFWLLSQAGHSPRGERYLLCVQSEGKGDLVSFYFSSPTSTPQRRSSCPEGRETSPGSARSPGSPVSCYNYSPSVFPCFLLLGICYQNSQWRSEKDPSHGKTRCIRQILPS